MIILINGPLGVGKTEVFQELICCSTIPQASQTTLFDRQI